MTARRIGLVVNPIAGMGGRAGLHGTDGVTAAAARARGAEPIAVCRARRTMSRLQTTGIDVLAAGSTMGSSLLTDLGISHTVVHEPAAPTSSDDTRAAVAALAEHAVDLLVVVGGDGTLRDVAAALAGRPTVLLGVPSGVKMHSAAFATTPEAAADVVSRYLTDPDRIGHRHADIVDLTADGPQLFASVRVPAVAAGLQAAKSGTATDDAGALAELGREIAREMAPGRLYLLGPGSTVGQVAAALDLPVSLFGVDAVLDGQMIGTDLDERALLTLLAAHGTCTLVLGVVGGQGFLLGRGNQQVSPAVIAAIGASNVVVLAAPAKIAALQPPQLHVDTGDHSAEQPLLGYQRVRTGRGHSTVLQIVA